MTAFTVSDCMVKEAGLSPWTVGAAALNCALARMISLGRRLSDVATTFNVTSGLGARMEGLMESGEDPSIKTGADWLFWELGG